MLRSLPKLNYNINEKEIYLKFSEEPSKNINPTISHYLNKSKKNIDTYQSEWDNTKKYTNDYEFVGSSRDVYTQIGNAVPCLLAKAIAKSIIPNLE